MSEQEEISILVEKKAILCDKKMLITNSDYFKRILGPHSFTESGSNQIELKDVESNIFQIILRMLWDNTYVVDNENILLVLQTSDMLQFRTISDICLVKTTELLTPITCIKIWFMTEHIHCNNAVPLYLKAKSLALQEFNMVKDLDCLFELNLRQICTYLASTNLHCDKEIHVFQTGMKWWYENCGNSEKILCNKDNNLLCLLSCLDFNYFSISDINEILTYPDISANKYICNILRCVVKKLKNEEFTEFNSSEATIAKILLTSNKRQSICEPYLIMDAMEMDVFTDVIIETDKYKRKRRYTTITEDNSSVLGTGKSPQIIVNYSEKERDFVTFMPLPPHKITRYWGGYKIIGYKEFIFLFGGESAIGRGGWNLDFWVYDTIRERWERKTKLPNGRRHFETCICDSIVYIIGGTGKFRVLRNDLIFYDFKNDRWSKSIELPCNSSSCFNITCCNFNNKLLLVNITTKCSYMFNSISLTFIEIPIVYSQNLPTKCSIYCYNGRIFLKGEDLLEFKLINGKFELINFTKLDLRHILTSDYWSSVLCTDYYYTLYRENNLLTVEKFDLTNLTVSFLIEDFDTENEFVIDNCKLKFCRYSQLFAFKRFELFKDDDFVNNFLQYLK